MMCVLPAVGGNANPNRFYVAAMMWDAERAVWLEEDEVYVRDNGGLFAAKHGNLEALQWLRSHDC